MTHTVLIFLIVIALFVALVIYACLVQSSKDTRAEEKNEEESRINSMLENIEYYKECGYDTALDGDNHCLIYGSNCIDCNKYFWADSRIGRCPECQHKYDEMIEKFQATRDKIFKQPVKYMENSYGIKLKWWQKLQIKWMR